MNWIDFVLIALLLASVIVGSKKGLVRETSAFLVFFVAVVVSVMYIDTFAVWVHEQFDGSPLVTAFLSFTILLAGSYAAFKLAGLAFYKVANIKSMGKQDQMGGALVGLLRGWVAVGFLTFLVFLLPLPDTFYTAFEASFLGPTIARTVPLIYEKTSPIHSQPTSFMDKVESALLYESTTSRSTSKSMDDDRIEVHRALYQMEKFFATTPPES